MNLYSRVQRIGNANGYRDIVIHEMTESEINRLKTNRWSGMAMGFVFGFLAGSGFVIFAMFPH